MHINTLIFSGKELFMIEHNHPILRTHW